MAIKQVVIMALASTALAQMSYMETPMDMPTPSMPVSMPATYPGAIDSSTDVGAASSAYVATESSTATTAPAEMTSSAMSSDASATETTATPMVMSGTTMTDMSHTSMTTMAGGMPMGTGGMGGMPNATSTSQPVAGSGALNSNSVSVGLFMVSVTFAALLQL